VQRSGPRRERPQKALARGADLAKTPPENNVEVIHANEPHALTAAWLARAHRRAALAVSRRVAYPLGRGWMSQDRYQAADRILAISRFVAESVVKSGIPRERITLVYEGVEIPAAVTREMRQAARRTLNIAEDEFLLAASATSCRRRARTISSARCRRSSSAHRVAVCCLPEMGPSAAIWRRSRRSWHP